MKLKPILLTSLICLLSSNAFAETAATAAAGVATGLCKDGTSYTGATKKGACKGHKGIKEWYADKQTPVASKPATSPAAPTATAATPPSPAATTSPAPTDAPATGTCKDGTPYTGATKKGACKGHKGIKEWFADKQTPAVSTPAATPTATTPPSPAATASPAPVNAPATGLCKDGTPYTGETKKGACKGHKGIKEWYADKQTPAASTPATAPAAAATTPPPAAPTQAPVKPAAPVAEPAKAATPATAPPTATAPVAVVGTGKVWVNTRSKIYHCEGTKFYGKTKDGEYMTQEEAKAKGYNANRKKDCK